MRSMNTKKHSLFKELICALALDYSFEELCDRGFMIEEIEFLTGEKKGDAEQLLQEVLKAKLKMGDEQSSSWLH